MTDTTFARYDHLPEPIRKAFAELEDMLGDLDGKTIATETGENTFIDEGTIVMDDAVSAFNTLVSALSPPVSGSDAVGEREACAKIADEVAAQCRVSLVLADQDGALSSTGRERIKFNIIEREQTAKSIASRIRSRPSPAPHDYSPSLNSNDMGDCSICGHTQTSPIHRTSSSPAKTGASEGRVEFALTDIAANSDDPIAVAAACRALGHSEGDIAPLTEAANQKRAALSAQPAAPTPSEGLRMAARKLANEVTALGAFDIEVRQVIGNTNYNVLMERVEECRAALSVPAGAWMPIETAPNDSGFRWYGLHVKHKNGHEWFEAHYVSHDDDGQMRLSSGDNFDDWAFSDFEFWCPAPPLPAAPALLAEDQTEAKS